MLQTISKLYLIPGCWSQYPSAHIIRDKAGSLDGWRGDGKLITAAEYP